MTTTLEAYGLPRPADGTVARCSAEVLRGTTSAAPEEELMLYIFEDYTLDTRRYELCRAGGLVPLDRQVFEVLAYLLAHPEQVVTRQELFEHLWPQRFVSDAALERCIAVARRALGDSGRDQRFIKTVHRRGYRFVAAVEAHPDAAPRPLALSPPLALSLLHTPVGSPAASTAGD